MAQDRTNIQRLCEFVIQPYAAKQRVSILHNNRLLLQFVQQYTLVCPNETKTYEGCQLCILEIKCLCKFVAGRDQYFAKIAHCESHLPNEHRVQYAVNLNFLQEFFNASELIPNSQELLDYIPRIFLPNLTFEQDQITQSLGLISSSIFNMSKVAQASLNDSAIFLDLGAIIEAKFQKLDLDLSKFSIKTDRNDSDIRKSCHHHTNSHRTHTATPAFPSTQCSCRFNSTSKSERFAPIKQNVGPQPVEEHRAQLMNNSRMFSRYLAMKPFDLETISATTLIFGILVTIVLFIACSDMHFHLFGDVASKCAKQLLSLKHLTHSKFSSP
jgi:hypothetical protein